MDETMDNSKPQLFAKSAAKQPRTTRPIPAEDSVYFEIEADLQVHVPATKFMCQAVNDMTKDLLLLGLPAVPGSCQDIVLNPEEGISSYFYYHRANIPGHQAEQGRCAENV